MTSGKRFKTAVHSALWYLALTAAFLNGCAQTPVKTEKITVTRRTDTDFAYVVAQPRDTLSSLASKYLNDPALDWIIADFNGIESIRPGQELIIPLRSLNRGGLFLKGYQTVPILSYHKFSSTKADRMTVTAAAFEEQMNLLKERGYRVITLDELFAFLEFKRQIPKKSVVITIDDGWRSAYDIAFPVLKRYGYPATLFVYTDLITGSRKTLSWDLLREMADSGIDIQCHSKTHTKMDIMKENESFQEYFQRIDRELTVSAEAIKKELNRDCIYFAYPYSDTNSLIVSLLKKNGYRGAVTVERGANPFFIGNYRVNRSMIYGTYDIRKFEQNLTSFSNEALR